MRMRIKTVITAVITLLLLTTSCKKKTDVEVSVYYTITNGVNNGSVEVNNNGEKLTLVATNQTFTLTKKVYLHEGEKYYFKIKADGGKCTIRIVSADRSRALVKEREVILEGRY